MEQQKKQYMMVDFGEKIDVVSIGGKKRPVTIASFPYNNEDEWVEMYKKAQDFKSRMEAGNKIKPKVKLVGEDGNAFAILGRVNRALKAAGMHEEAKAFMAEAITGDYDHLLATVQKYVDAE